MGHDSLTTWHEAFGLLQDVRLAQVRETIPLADANGRKLAEDVFAKDDYPRFRSSAMDGYALHADDIANLTQGLELAGTTLAGELSQPLTAGTTFAVMTGAPVPDDAAGVVPVEYARIEDGKLFWDEKASTRHIRNAGEDFKTGQCLFKDGDILTPARLVLMASAGLGACRVWSRPSVSLLVTGSELQGPDEGPLDASQVFDATSVSLHVMAELARGKLLRVSRLEDDQNITAHALENEVSNNTRLIVTTGGVSKGEADHIPTVVEQLGGEVVLHRLAIKPAKPLLVARFPNGSVLVGLPGNPISQMLAMQLVVVPLLRGESPLQGLLFRKAELLNGASAKKGFMTFLRGRTEWKDNVLQVRILEGQESHRVSNLAEANAWVMAEESLKAGSMVKILPFMTWEGEV